MNKTSDSFNPLCVADVLGLGTIDAGDDGVDAGLLRDLYRHARGEDGKRTLFTNNPSFPRGWIDLESPRAHELVSVFVALDDEDDLKHARRMAQNNLEAQPWNDVLGVNDPPIQLKIKIHGTKWGMRFQSGAAAMKGQEPINEHLPPIPSDPAADHATAAPTTAVVNEDERAQPQNQSSTSAAIDPMEILRKGGMPV